MGELRPDRFGSRPRRVGHRLRVTLPSGLAADAAALLREYADEVEVRDGVGGDDDGPRSRVECALDPGEPGDAAAAALTERLEELERRHPGADFDLEREEHLVEEDRGAVHRERFLPFSAAPGLVLRPPWREYAARPGERVLVVDPGRAFGSGSHASTRLALALLRERCRPAPPRRVLDLGTGTGVLAMAAAVWGAAAVVGVDCDPEAVAAARGNVARNGLGGAVVVEGRGLEELAGRFDVIVANVTADVLLAVAPALAGRLEAGGALVLSGLLAGGQDAEALAAYGRLGLRCADRRREGEWTALLLVAAGGDGGERGAETREPSAGRGRRRAPRRTFD